jgi:hypothetical protein
VQTICADHKVERAYAMSVERDSDVLDGLVDASNGVAKDRFDAVAECAP